MRGREKTRISRINTNLGKHLGEMIESSRRLSDHEGAIPPARMVKVCTQNGCQSFFLTFSATLSGSCHYTTLTGGVVATLLNLRLLSGNPVRLQGGTKLC